MFTAERLYDTLETGKLGLDDLAPRIQQLRHRQEQLQSRKWELEVRLSDRRVELADLEMVTRCVDDLRSLLEEADFTERKTFLRSFIRRIVINKKQVTISYNLPMPPEGEKKQSVGVLPIVTPLVELEGFEPSTF